MIEEVSQPPAAEITPTPESPQYTTIKVETPETVMQIADSVLEQIKTQFHNFKRESFPAGDLILTPKRLTEFQKEIRALENVEPEEKTASLFRDGSSLVEFQWRQDSSCFTIWILKNSQQQVEELTITNEGEDPDISRLYISFPSPSDGEQTSAEHEQRPIGFFSCVGRCEIARRFPKSIKHIENFNSLTTAYYTNINY